MSGPKIRDCPISTKNFLVISDPIFLSNKKIRGYGKET